MSRLFAFREIPEEVEKGEASASGVAGFVYADDAKAAEETVREEYEVTGALEIKRFKGSGLIFIANGARMEGVEEIDSEDDGDGDDGDAGEAESTMYPVVDFSVAGPAAETFLGFLGVDIEALIEEATVEGEDDDEDDGDDDGEDLN